MTNINLDELFYNIQEAVNNSNESVRQKYLADLDKYFDESGKPIMIDMDIPYVTDGGTEFRKFQIPKLTLIPLSVMKVKEIDIDFKVALSQLPPEVQKEASVNSDESKPEPQQGKPHLFKRQKKANLQADIESSCQKIEDRAHVHIKMEGSEPPEGVIKINDYLMKYLP